MTDTPTLNNSIPSQLREWMEELADAHADLEASDTVLNGRKMLEAAQAGLNAAEGPFRARIAEAEKEIRAIVNVLQHSAETDRVKVTYRRASESPYYPAEDLRKVLLLYPDVAKVVQPIQKVRFSPAGVSIHLKDLVEGA